MYIMSSEIGGSPLVNSSNSPSATAFERKRLFARLNELTGVAEVEVVKDLREMRVRIARWAVVLHLRKQGWSTRKIGKFIDRDHKAVIRMVALTRKRYDENVAFAVLVDSLAA